MLEAKNLTLVIDGHTLLDNISLQVTGGNFVCVAGANGAGKSLLLKTLGGLLKPTQGQILFEKTDTAALTPRQRSKKIRFLPSQAQSVFNYRARDIVLMGANPYIEWWQDYTPANQEAAQKAMASTNTAALGGRGILTLSDGELQRVFIAQALAGAPEVILPDEPTSHLDLKQKDIIFKLFAAVAARGSAVICATHDIELAKKYATHICLLEGGRLAAFAPARQITDEQINKAYCL